MFLNDIDINTIKANELLPQRAALYSKIHNADVMIQGNIMESKVFKEFKEFEHKFDLLIATPPCQGVSIAGKNRDIDKMSLDERNYLIYKVIEFVYLKNPPYVLIENVPMFLKLHLPYKGKLTQIKDILHSEFSNKYEITLDIMDSADFGTPQKRKRSIIRMYQKGLSWDYPSKQKHITVHDAISHLPSIESGEHSGIPWHFARKHIDRHILWMKHTPTGKSAFENPEYYPAKPDGSRIKGYNSTYRRIKWDEPAPSITIRNDAISSQRNVHPGRKLLDNTYSDARVLSPHELLLLTGISPDKIKTEDTSEILLRQCLGECVPPKLINTIVEKIGV